MYSGVLSSPFFAASWASNSLRISASRTRLRKSGESACPCPALALITKSMRLCGISLPFTFATGSAACAPSGATANEAAHATARSLQIFRFFILYPWVKSNFVGSIRFDRKRVYLPLEHVSKRCMNHAMARLRRLAFELRRNDDELEVSTAAFSAFVAGMLLAVVDKLDAVRRQYG